MSINQGFSYRGRIERPLDAERLVDYLSRRYPHSSPADWRACGPTPKPE
jgi:hypothetical protein